MNERKRIHPLAEILSDLFVVRNWQERLRINQVFSFWADAVGGAVAFHAEPHILRGRTLWIRVCDSIWMHHLQFEKVLILEKLNARLGAPLVNDIRFTLDASLGKKKTKEKAPPHRQPIPVKIPVELEQVLGALPDSELKDIIKRLWTKQHTTQKADSGGKL